MQSVLSVIILAVNVCDVKLHLATVNFFLTSFSSTIISIVNINQTFLKQLFTIDKKTNYSE